MLNLEVTTKLSQEEVAKLATGFFGKNGLGLAVVDENPQFLYFEGGGGYVNAPYVLRRAKPESRSSRRNGSIRLKSSPPSCLEINLSRADNGSENIESCIPYYRL